ncbi:MAG: TlyA family RNA methyltransferase [Ruminococcus sp.]|nr:TlyA family RNA methyltransferase [Ruminococcus sp.]
MARLDSELVARGISRSRERAKEMIKNGNVTVNGKVVTKPAYDVLDEDEIVSAENELYVGRGALKLEKAAKEFCLDFTGTICLDIGASTGGFTDYMLQNGAARVFAVDVGHGQLVQSLREDSRVVNAEGTDVRTLTTEFLGGEVDFICADVSFISLKMILPKMYELLKEGACAAVLIKPQFEAGRSNIGKNGIVKDKKVHEQVLRDIDSFALSTGFFTEKYTYSPIKGGSGNIEYLVKLVKDRRPPVIHDFRSLAEEAFRQL